MLRRSKDTCKSLTASYTSFHVALQQTSFAAHATSVSPYETQEISPMLTAEQLVAAQKANLETLFDLTNKAFEGVEKLVELNLQVAKASMTEVQATAAASLGVKDAQEVLAPKGRPAPPRRGEGPRLRSPPVRHRRVHQRRSDQG